jgi:hypothetical protein
MLSSYVTVLLISVYCIYYPCSIGSGSGRVLLYRDRCFKESGHCRPASYGLACFRFDLTLVGYGELNQLPDTQH